MQGNFLKKSIVNFWTNTKTRWPEQLLWPFLVAVPVGLAAGFFLTTLDGATRFREAHLPFSLWMLPLGGLCIGCIYHKYGKESSAGNVLLFDEASKPEKRVPLIMAPLVYVGTMITHALGGSAGREGTAVQMGGAIADAFTPLVKATQLQRRTLLLAGISAGFAAVFGTPLAGALFALEVVKLGQSRWQYVVPVIIAAFVANETTHLTGAHHTDYSLVLQTQFSWSLVMWIAIVAVLFGFVAQVFARATHFVSRMFAYVPHPVFRPVLGGLVLVAVFSFTSTQAYMGLGIPQIQASFVVAQLPWVFALKLLFTAFTIGSGFKGGEVTPLFFTGAALGSALSVFLPVDTAFLAALGFVAVFAGATKTPFASALIGMELFGFAFGPYLLAATLLSRWASGSTGVYGNVAMKYWFYKYKV